MNLANNQVSHNTKVKSGKEIRQLKTSKHPIKNIVAQHQME
jgi:hypothetical protein